LTYRAKPRHDEEFRKPLYGCALNEPLTGAAPRSTRVAAQWIAANRHKFRRVFRRQGARIF
jgi:hypothetical protein